MFAIPGICALVVFILARPQEFLEILQRVPLLYVFSAAAVVGFLVDLRLRRLQPVAAPSLKWVLLFLGWATVCNVAKVPSAELMTHTIELAILFVIYATLAHGVQGWRAFHVVAGTVMGTCLFLSAVCAHQGLQPRGCVAVDDTRPGEGRADDRPCETAEACYGQGAEPGAEYVCERIGMFGTFTVEDRVRYRGELHDPNELALTVIFGATALLVAFGLRKRTTGWVTFAVVGVLLVGFCVIETASRGGMVGLLIVGAVYFVRRYGIRGLIAGAVAGAPLILLGGRSGANAATSTEQRYEAWDAGLQMFRHNPIFGVGHRMFTDHHYLTAHNSYVLTLAELGFVGQVLFVALMAINGKMLWAGIHELEGVPGAEVARIWALALFAAFCGIAFQIFTLSFAYHSVLWIFFGMCGAWASAVRHHKPDFEVRLTVRDLGLIVIGCAVFSFLILPLFLRYKGA